MQTALEKTSGIDGFVTVAQIAQELGQPWSRIIYVLRSRCDRIKPLGRVGNTRIYPRSAIPDVEHEMAAMQDRAVGAPRTI